VFWIIKWIKRFVILVLLISIGYSAYQYYLNNYDLEQAVLFVFDIVIYYILPFISATYIVFKLIIEKLILSHNRKKSAEALANRLPKINQKSGAVRAGKDSSTVSAALLVKEYILNQEIKEMKEIRNQLYIYDFEKINYWLDRNGERFLVSGEDKITKIYIAMLRENQCFLQPVIKKKIDYRMHLYQWRKHKGSKVLDYAFKDGLTPGGIPFLSLLKSYVIMYVQHIFVPNFIMSNQPIMESFKIDKTKINKLMSKKFSQDYIKLKENTPIPLPLRGFIIETETAIFYSNTNRGNESEDKSSNGIREFMTTAGHTLQERVYYYGITQSPTRTSKSIRELYQGYQHVFKSKARATSNYIRAFLSILIFLLAIIKTPFHFTRKKIKRELHHDLLNFITTYISKVISRIKSTQKKLYNKGYMEFYIGVYENLSDVGKKVPFPKVGVILESKTDNNTYSAYGFKQTVKISDTWGRYDTHYMKFIREEKERIHDMHFDQVPNWNNNFYIDHKDAEFSGYKVFKDILKFVHERLDEIRKEERKKEVANIQRWRMQVETPNFAEMSPKELLNLSKDYGIETDEMTLENYDQWADSIINRLTSEFKKFRSGKGLL